MHNMPADIKLIYSGDTLHLSGVLTMDSVPGAEQQLKVIKAKFKAQFNVDLNDITAVDSAGLAMLINIKAQFESKDTKIGFLNAPESLKKLSKLSDADKLLQI